MYFDSEAALGWLLVDIEVAALCLDVLSWHRPALRRVCKDESLVLYHGCCGWWVVVRQRRERARGERRVRVREGVRVNGRWADKTTCTRTFITYVYMLESTAAESS